MLWASADSVVMVPASPTQVRAPPPAPHAERLQVVRGPPGGLPPPPGRRVGSQTTLGQPDTPDISRIARHRHGTPPTTISVDPPPKSTTTKGAPALSNSPTAPRNDNEASSPPLITSATAPGITAPSTSAVIAKKSSRLATSRAADVATIRTFLDTVHLEQLGVVGQCGPGPGHRVRRELTRRVDSLP